MTREEPRIQRALLSTWRKEGVADFAQFLASLGVELVSTGGTARVLKEAGLAVMEVAALTGFPEMLEGRVKTLHPRIHGGLLFRRDRPDHVEAVRQQGIPAIDLVVVDLYPFEEVSSRPEASAEEVVEMIDIGGPAMVRSAAKNHDHVLVVVEPADLGKVKEELQRGGGTTTIAFRRRMAAKAFRRTAAYDAVVAAWLTDERFPERLVVPLELKEITRYGENPHQQGAVYLKGGGPAATVARARKLSGKELSYNNYLDASAALEMVRGFGQPAAVLVKHRNPCGAAVHPTDPVRAFEAAYAGDPVSAFGGILALNRPVGPELARVVADPGRFLEVVVAPEFDEAAVTTITSRVKWGRSVRLLAVGALDRDSAGDTSLELRSISGGVLVQERDAGTEARFECVTRQRPSPEQESDLRFAWEICRHVVSNAIVLARGGQLVGCGAGQTSRVDAVVVACRQAGNRASGAVLASDAFFPFPDAVLQAKEAGVSALVQPGGSVRDAEVIAACDSHGLAMVLTGRRHFRH